MTTLTDIYDRLDAEVARHRPRCEMSGRCCDFPRSELKLYASTLEVEHARADGVPEAPSGRCPWYVDGMCGNRAGRPLGCRVYFCDPDWADAMPDVYERFHAEIVALHERRGVAYAYAPFVEAVRR